MSEDRITRPEPGLIRVLAPNPSPMTHTGTNTYIVGDRDVCVIDPGPLSEDHLGTLLGLLDRVERVSAILVTHSHLDHSPLAAPLGQATGAPVLAAGPSDWGRSPAMQALADTAALGGGEGVDVAFTPDARIGEGDRIDTDRGPLRILETPGHMANHLSFGWGDALFSGDLVMGWASSLISPPDGDLAAFMASVARLETREDRVLYPGHGAPVPDPAGRCRELLDHRKTRHAQIRAALSDAGAATASELARAIYTDLQPGLLPAAARNVLAHLIALHDAGLARVDGPLQKESRFAHYGNG